MLIGSKSGVCNGVSEKVTLFCGAVSDGSRCGMSNQVMIRLQVADVIKDWKGRLPSSGSGDENANGGSGQTTCV